MLVKRSKKCRNLKFAITLLISCTCQCCVSLSLWSHGQRISLSRAHFTLYSACIIYVDFSFVLVLLVVARHAWKSSQSTKYAPWRWTSDSVSTHIVEVNQQHPKDWLLPRFTNISDYDDLNSRNFPFQSARREIFLSLSVSRLIIFVQI